MGTAELAAVLFNSPLANLQAGPPLRVRRLVNGTIPVGTGQLLVSIAVPLPPISRGSLLLFEQIAIQVFNVSGGSGLGVAGGNVLFTFSDSSVPPVMNIGYVLSQVTATGLNVLGGGVSMQLQPITVTDQDLVQGGFVGQPVSAVPSPQLPLVEPAMQFTMSFINSSAGPLAVQMAMFARIRLVVGVQEN